MVAIAREHILAVSGLNVSIVGGLLYFLMRLAGFPQKLNAFISLIFVSIYVLISGYNAPVLRAGIMGAILMGGLLIERESEILNSLGIAFFALLFFKPQNLFLPGFQLSFLSVLAILLIVPRFNIESFGTEKNLLGVRRRSFWRGVLRFYLSIFLATAAATVGTLPLVLYYFRIASPISFLANLSIVPLMNLATFSGFLILPSLFAPDWVGACLKWLPLLSVKVSLVLNHLLARIPFASFYVPSLPMYLLWIYYGVILVFFLLPRERRKRLASGWVLSTIFVSTLVIGIFVSLIHRDSSLRIHILHLKQGRVVFFQFPGGIANLLMNTGKGKPQDEWKWVVKPFLMSRGVQTLSAILLSSFESRDIGGLEGLMSHFKCETVFLPRQSRHPSTKGKGILGLLRRRKVKVQFLSAQQRIEGFTDVRLEWFADGKDSFMKVQYQGKNVLVVFEGTPDASGEDFVIKVEGLKEAKTFQINSHKSQVESFPLK